MNENNEIPATDTPIRDEVREKEILELVSIINSIGIARFVGRINSGLIDYGRGMSAVDFFLTKEKKRPLLSKLSHLVTGAKETYY